jgi:NAD(P)-dependent dehydrogenase (short-subunit alcohol dehydrogenase family)
MSSKNQQRVILVTGANKGLGFEVVKKLVKQTSSSNNDLILLGSRDLQRGQEAIVKLGSPSNVRLIQLDTSSPDSIARATNEIKQKYGGKLDIVINNAGIGKVEKTADVAREIFATNYYGIKLLNQHLSPLIQENGRIINVASEIGAWTLHEMSNNLQNKYKSSTLTEEEIDTLLKDFISALESNSVEKLGYNEKSLYLIYGVSKAALIALTRVEARQWSGAKNVLVLAVCPGYCATDLNNHGAGARPAELGADSILHPATAPANELTNGQFYQDGQLKSQSYACDMDFSKFSEHSKNNQ